MAALTIRWAEAGHSIEMVAKAVQPQLELAFDVEHVLNLMVTWDKVNYTRCHPASRQIVKAAKKEQVAVRLKSLKGHLVSVADLVCTH